MLSSVFIKQWLVGVVYTPSVQVLPKTEKFNLHDHFDRPSATLHQGIYFSWRNVWLTQEVCGVA